ncbi:hypothetical protein Tco_1277045, partial [Tanacetum coccineum]
LKNYETLKKQCDDLIVKLNDTEFKAATYKRGLATIEDQLVTYKKNEVLFSEEIIVLKREVGCKEYEIGVLKSEFEKVKQEKEGIDFKITKFDNASKDLDKLLESQISEKNKQGLGYHVVAPPHPLIYNRPTKIDLSYLGLDEFKEPEFNGYGPRDTVLESTKDCDKESDNSKENTDDSLEKEQVSEDTSSSSNYTSSLVESSLKFDRETIIDWHKTGFHTTKKVEFVKPKNNEKPVKKTVRYAEIYRSQSPRGNQRNWNGQKSNQLGSEFVMCNKACFICGGFKHVQRNCTYHQKKKVVSGNNYNRVDNYYYGKTSHHRTYKNVTPRVVLLRTGLKPLSTAKSYYTAHLKPTVNIVRPRIVNTARSYRTPVNIVMPRVINTARQNKTSVNAAKANGFNVGKPQHDDKGFVDSGCSRHMTGNIAYLSDFKQFDEVYVAFGGVEYGVSTSIGYGVSSFLSITAYSSQQINTAYPLPLDTSYRSSGTESEIFDFLAKFLPFFKTNPTDCLSLVSEYSKKEETKAMAKTMEQHMSKTRTDYGSGVARPKIDNKDQFELKGQFLKELRENTFSGSDKEDANEHIEKVLEIVDLFHVPNITMDQLMLRVFHISLTGAASHWLRNKPTGSIKT